MLASIGTVGDALDNAMAESFVDSYKTELIKDRVWQSRSQLELGTLDYVTWFNHQRLHESLGDIPPVKYEALHATQIVAEAMISGDRSPQAIARRPADGLKTRPSEPVGVDFALHTPIDPDNGSLVPALLAQTAPTGALSDRLACGLDETYRFRSVRSQPGPEPINPVSVEPGPAHPIGDDIG